MISGHRFFCDNKEWPLNRRVAKYGSHIPDLDAYHVNGFSLYWSDLNSYIFSQFIRVERVQDCTGSGDSLGDCSLLANKAMIPTICAVGETWHDTTIDTSPSTPALATRKRLRTANLGLA